MIYIDTSVFVAALTNESRTAEMQSWLASQRPDDLVISDWVMTEFSAALSIKVRTDQIIFNAAWTAATCRSQSPV